MDRRRHTAAAAIARHGVGMVHQHFMLVETLTVAENLILGNVSRPIADAWIGIGS